MVTFGPIIASPKLNLKLEKALKSKENLFCFALLKYGPIYTDDFSDYQNFLRLDKDRLCL